MKCPFCGTEYVTNASIGRCGNKHCPLYTAAIETNDVDLFFEALAAAEQRGWERAREQAKAECDAYAESDEAQRYAMYESAARLLAERIGAMPYEPEAGER